MDSTVSQKGGTYLSTSADYDVHRFVLAQNLVHLLDKLINIVAAPLVAGYLEHRQVFPHQCRGSAYSIAQVVGEHFFHSHELEFLDNSSVLG